MAGTIDDPNYSTMESDAFSNLLFSYRIKPYASDLSKDRTSIVKLCRYIRIQRRVAQPGLKTRGLDNTNFEQFRRVNRSTTISTYRQYPYGCEGHISV